MRLDHVTIVCADCAPLLRFFVDVAGMVEGPRPAFGVRGHWLYLQGRPVLHLVERPAARPRDGADAAPPTARIDHVALRVDDAGEWQTLLGRLRDSGMPYQLADARALREQQLFVVLMPDVVVEFVGGAHF
jgi:catechol 2,3-dioxygenase-like lactoylglutathione lyase family enzyme